MDNLLVVTLRALMERKRWNAYQHVLSEDSFPATNAAAVYRILGDLHGTSKRNVSDTALRMAIEASVSEDRAAELGSIVNSMMEVERDVLAEADFAIRRYAARGLALRSAKMVLTQSDDPGFDYNIPAGLAQKASAIASGTPSSREEAMQAGLPGDPGMVRSAVPLGIHAALDAELMGGVGRGELLVFLAPPERGKTSYLWRVAANAVLAGERVAAFTMEIAKYKCFLRYYQALTGLTSTEMIHARQLVSLKRAQAAKKGKLWVHDYTCSNFTPALLEFELESMVEEGHRPTYVMLDYLQLMKPSGGFGKRGRDSASLGEMVQNVRQISMAYKVPIVTAWQINRAGADKTVFTSSDVSESWELIKVADIILGLNQGPMELTNNYMRLKTMKQREDPSRKLHELHSDMRRLIIRPMEGSTTDGNEEDEEAVAS